jgi:hypothetical protein
MYYALRWYVLTSEVVQYNSFDKWTVVWGLLSVVETCNSLCKIWNSHSGSYESCYIPEDGNFVM